MIRRGVVVGVLVWLLLGAGCATTQLESESYVNPETPGRAIRKIMVMVTISEFGPRTQAEQAFVERLARGSTQALASATLMVPDRKYARDEFNAFLKQHQIDAVLMVTLTADYKQQIQSPGYATCSSALASANAAMLESRECNIDNFISRPTLEFKFRFYEVATDKTLWEAASVTQGTNMSGFQTLIRSLAPTTVQKMIQDGALP
jgi:hypothetical protein